ncbi:MAG: hypothetical protein FWE78_02265 [Methanimicrococcus sp.]|nr:hypothetical protein [Methanimicrococcus sp.]
MTLNFTTGIPEIDRLTGGRIENGSFLLAAGNDDEGMKLFLAEVLKNQGRPAGGDGLNSNGCKIVKITSENREETLEFCRSFREKEESEDDYLFVVESLSELCGNDKPFHAVSEKTILKSTEEECVISFVREIKQFLKNGTEKQIHVQPQKLKVNHESTRLFIGCLYENIFPAEIENRIKHISDCYFQFRMEERGMQFERTVLIYKYDGGEAGGRILKYTVDGGQLNIENKKRIY